MIGISTSGAAAYVKSAIEYGKSIGGKTAYLICNKKPYLSADADVIIKVDTGPEVITGSTRMKSGHRYKNGAEYDFYGYHGTAGQSIWQSHGGSYGGE